MKRLLVLVLCLVLALTAVSAQAVSIAQVVGRWYIISMDGKGLMGENYFEFNRDKSVTMVIKSEARDELANAEWTFANDEIKVKSKNGMVLYYTFTTAEGELELVSSGLAALAAKGTHTYKLAREPLKYYMPEAAAAASEDLFFGEYTLYLAAANGQYIEMDSDANGFDIALYVVTVHSEGQPDVEYLTNYVDGKLIVYAQEDTIINLTDDPDVLISYAASSPNNKVYLRRKGTAQPDIVPQATVEPTAPAPAVTEPPIVPSAVPAPVLPTMVPIPAVPTPVVPAPAVPTPKPVQPAKPVFPGLITPSGNTTAPAADSGDVSAFYGSYIVYQDKLANGRVLDMTSYGLKAAIDADGVHATAYGRSVTVPFDYQGGKMTADISAISPDYGFAAAELADNGELIVTLSDTTGNVGETLYLKPEN